jgi:hypothetical protein
MSGGKGISAIQQTTTPERSLLGCGGDKKTNGIKESETINPTTWTSFYGAIFVRGFTGVLV